MNSILRISAAGSLAVLLLSGCMGIGASVPSAGPATEPVTSVAAVTPVAATTDYCPVLNVRDGTETLRRHAGNDASPSALVWQATIADAARECRVSPDGRMTIRVGIAGRVLAGPKGGPGAVAVPVRVVVIKHPEQVLASELKRLSVTIPPDLSVGFREVFEVTVPSPGEDRDYLVYVGFDEAGRV